MADCLRPTVSPEYRFITRHCTRLLSTLAGSVEQVTSEQNSMKLDRVGKPSKRLRAIPRNTDLEVGEDSTGIRLGQRKIGVAQGAAKVDLPDSSAVASTPEHDGRLAQPAGEARHPLHSTGVELRAKLVDESKHFVVSAIFRPRSGGGANADTGKKPIPRPYGERMILV